MNQDGQGDQGPAQNQRQGGPLPQGGLDPGGDNVIGDELIERVGSDVVTVDTRILSQNLIEILHNLEASQWDDGWVTLGDGFQFRLWSAIHPEPSENEGESMDAFVLRQRAARLERLTILANRAQRTLDARAAQNEARCASLPPVQPPLLPPRDATVEADDRFAKQVLLNQLANRAAEDTTDPLDKPMFEFLDRVEAEAARAAFQKVLNDPAGGLEALTPEERKTMADWKSKSEIRNRKKAEEAARTLGVYSQIYSDQERQLAKNSAAAAPITRPTPIRVTCPRFNPATDPIGSLTTWLAGVQNFHSLQRITDLEDKKKGTVRVH